jgi:hypothetical protein
MNIKQRTEDRLRRYKNAIVTAAAVAVMAFAGLAAAGTAQAATHAPAHVASVTSQVKVITPFRDGAIPQYISGNVTFENSAGEIFESASCAEGTSGSMPTRPYYAENGCGTRVWLYEYTSHTGYTLCLNKDSNTGYLQRSYKSFWVSFNSANC